MRHRTKGAVSCFTLIAGAALLCSGDAAAADEGALERVLDLGFRAAPLKGQPEGLGYVVGGELSYRIYPAWRLGTYVEGVAISQSCDFCEESDGVRFGLRTELHMIPDGTWDPWIAVSLGGFHMSEISGSELKKLTGGGFEIGADAGLDIHFGWFSVGPAFSIMYPAVNGELFAATWYHSLLPTFRAQIAF